MKTTAVIADKSQISTGFVLGLLLTAGALLSLPGLAKAQEAPEFATNIDGVGLREYNPGTAGIVSNENFDAAVVYLGNNQWELQLKAKKKINSVYFPWSHERKPLDPCNTPEQCDEYKSNDIFYYPYIGGISKKAPAHDRDWTWWGLDYPGSAFAPLVIMADNHKAQMVAATNWPPRKVSPRYAAQRMVLFYDEPLAAGTQRSYRAIITEVSGNAAEGNVPWQLAIDQYRAWLDTKVPPVQYPEWLENIHGFINFGLNNMYTFNISQIRAYWDLWKDKLPWIQFWGQMGPYKGNCCGLSSDELTIVRDMYPGYMPDLIDFAEDVAAEGKHVGYYSTPYYGTDITPKKMLDTLAGRFWLLSWISQNASMYKANAHYIDTLGRDYYGTPGIVRDYFVNKTIPGNSLIEGFVDIYPSASLLSGCLDGGFLKGGPGKTPENSDETTFPRFGRYLLGERVIFMGGSNNDTKFWGEQNNYWTERQTFLLGAKLDAGSLNVEQPANLYPAHQPGHRGARNAMVLSIIDERDRVRWWERKPVYLDTKGLSQIPTDVEVRRFRDKDGKDLVVVDNWNQSEGLSFLLDGILIPIPAQQIAILDIEEVLNQAPVMSGIGNKTVTVGRGMLEFKVSAADPDQSEGLNFSVYPLPQGASFSPSSETEYLFKWTPSVTQKGELWITFFVKDRFNVEDQKTILIAVRQLPGDASGDGRVDGADYTVWADNAGKTNPDLRADLNGDGKVDGADYTVWADHYAPMQPEGDANRDGKVDAGDYTLWADNAGKAEPDLRADFNGDGKVDGADYTVWADHYKVTKPGDANGDGIVDGADYTVWADNMGKTNLDLRADFNNDGKVDAGDYTIWADNYDVPASAQTAQPAAVPEIQPVASDSVPAATEPALHTINEDISNIPAAADAPLAPAKLPSITTYLPNTPIETKTKIEPQRTVSITVMQAPIEIESVSIPLELDTLIPSEKPVDIKPAPVLSSRPVYISSSKSIAPAPAPILQPKEVLIKPAILKKTPTQRWMEMISRWLAIIAEKMGRAFPTTIHLFQTIY